MELAIPSFLFFHHPAVIQAGRWMEHVAHIPCLFEPRSELRLRRE